jgi:hypothetical protein
MIHKIPINIANTDFVLALYPRGLRRREYTMKFIFGGMTWRFGDAVMAPLTFLFPLINMQNCYSTPSGNLAVKIKFSKSVAHAAKLLEALKSSIPANAVPTQPPAKATTTSVAKALKRVVVKPKDVVEGVPSENMWATLRKRNARVFPRRYEEVIIEEL